MTEYVIEVWFVQKDCGFVYLDSNLSLEELKAELTIENLNTKGNLISESQMSGALQGNDVCYYEVGEIRIEDDSEEEYWGKVMEDNEFLDYLDSKKEEKKKLP